MKIGYQVCIVKPKRDKHSKDSMREITANGAFCKMYDYIWLKRLYKYTVKLDLVH